MQKDSRKGKFGKGCVELSPIGFFRALVILIYTVHLGWGCAIAMQCSPQSFVMCFEGDRNIQPLQRKSE